MDEIKDKIRDKQMTASTAFEKLLNLLSCVCNTETVFYQLGNDGQKLPIEITKYTINGNIVESRCHIYARGGKVENPLDVNGLRDLLTDACRRKKCLLLFNVGDVFGTFTLRDIDAVDGALVLHLSGGEAPADPSRQDIRAAILDKAKERVTDYGTPEESFTAHAMMLTAYLRQARPDLRYALDAKPLSAKDSAMSLALLKVVRIATGNTPDSYVDLAGYASCAGELDTETKEGKTQ